MAITAKHAVSSSAEEPTLENYFGLHIEDEYENHGISKTELKWKNPYQHSTIHSYIPGDNKKLIKDFESAMINNKQPLSSSEGRTFSYRDVTVFIISYLDLKDVIEFSKVNKCCFLATKTDIVWRMQLCKLLPQVEIMDSKLCTFTPEQQFKIIYKRIANECNPYIAKFNYNRTECLELNSQLKEIELQFEKVGGQVAIACWRTQIYGLTNNGMPYRAAFATLKDTSDYSAVQLGRKLDSLKPQILSLGGKDYDGSIESIDPNSDQAKIMHAINALVPAAFDNQEKFAAEISKAQAVANTSSSMRL